MIGSTCSTDDSELVCTTCTITPLHKSTGNNYPHMSEQDTSSSAAAPERDPKNRKIDEPAQLETPPGQPPMLPPFKKHEDLWFDDGSIVLIARGAGFKVSVIPLLLFI